MVDLVPTRSSTLVVSSRAPEGTIVMAPIVTELAEMLASIDEPASTLESTFNLMQALALVMKFLRASTSQQALKAPSFQ